MNQLGDQPDPEEQQERHAIIGQDPWLEEFARSPYDPLNSARATGRLTGLAARQVYQRGWMRIGAFLLGLALVASAIGAPFELSLSPVPLLVTLPFAFVGIRLILSAVHPNPPS